MRATLLFLMVLIAACGSQAATPSGGPSPSDAPSPSSVTPPSAEVLAVLTGVPIVADDGSVEWCPYGSADDCPGIPVTGVSPDAIEALNAPNRAWQIQGRFDGRRLAANGSPEPVEWQPSYDFATPCEGLRGQHDGSGNMDQDAVAAIAEYVATIPDRYAGQWWDNETAVMTVLLTGDGIAGHRAALEEAIGERGTVCVAGGARHTLADLERAQQRATDIAMDAGLGVWSSSVDVVGNRVDLEVERSDEPARERIRREAGDAVRIRAYLALRDATVAQLPEPAARGDIELETADTHSGVGMTAYAEFTVRFDKRRRCVYGEFGGERVGLIWPFGYYATSEPPRVFDDDGRVVARDGDRLASAGGGGPREGATACGTDDVWVINGRPEAPRASEG